MLKKPPPGIRGMPVQRGEETTDPAIPASSQEAAKRHGESRRAAERLLKRCRRLSVEKLRTVAVAVASQLEPTYQWDFLEDMAKYLPADVLQQITEELRPQTAKARRG